MRSLSLTPTLISSTTFFFFFKDSKSRTALGLFSLRSQSRLLLTGTPLQNDLEEFWTLLHFLDPKEFARSAAFTARFGSGDVTVDQVLALTSETRKYLLRRMKASEHTSGHSN